MAASWVPTGTLIRQFYRRLAVWGGVAAIVPLGVLAVSPVVGVALGVVGWTYAVLLASMAFVPASPGLDGTTPLSDDEAGPLRARVAAITEAAGGPHVDDLRLTRNGRVRLLPVGGGPRRSPRWVLLVGVGALQWLTVDQLSAVLAREQKRYAGEDLAEEAWIVSVLCTLDEARWVRPWLLVGSLRSMARNIRLERSRRRAARLPLGDAAAAALVGREAADAALVRRAEAEQLAAWHAERGEADVTLGLRDFAARPDVAARLEADRSEALQREDPGWPRLMDRLAHPDRWLSAPPPDDGPFATSLVPGMASAEARLPPTP